MEIAQKLTRLPAEQLAEADPHLTIAGRRGRFLARPHRGKLRLSDAANPGRDPLEVRPEDLPAFLDGHDSAPAVENPAETSVEVFETTKPRTGLVASLFFFSVAVLAISGYMTFRDVPWDPDADYSAVPAAELPALKQKITGVFHTGKSETPRTLTLRSDGTVTLVEFGADHAIADQREDRYKLALRGNTAVARATRLGPIELRSDKTLRYAGEDYTREP